MNSTPSARTTSARAASSAAAAGVPAGSRLGQAGPDAAVTSRWASACSQIRAQLTADDAVPGRRCLQLCLALAWLLDAALQYQPFMFRPSFVTTIIEPAVAGNPGLVTSTAGWASQLMLHQVALSNAVFATIQLVIAVGLLCRRTVRPALVLSICWALAIWWLGEGMGGVLTGLSPLAGVPGAALLYALIAILVWPSPPGPAGRTTSVAGAGPAGGTAAKIAWLAVWGCLAHYLLLPANRAPEAISQVLSDTDGQPRWLAAVLRGLSEAAAHHGPEISVVLAVLCVGIGLALLARSLVRPALVLAAALGIMLFIAQGLGGILTGQGTDPGTGPLLILLAACYLPRRARQPAPGLS
ncbi:MAG TPA: hypothetical protein VGI64_14165 [Streptosporangiaceae bacterium]